MQRESPPRTTVVVGAGIIGACCALRLAREGRDVVLVDRLDPGSACSYGNAGALSPAAVVPMALPGMLRKVPGWLADPLGPLAVRWSYAPRVAPWILRWIAASRVREVEAASTALGALNRGTLEGFRELLSPAQFGDLVQLSGHLYVWKRRPVAAGDLLAQALRERHGIRTRWLDAGTLREMEPHLDRAYAAGLLLPDNGHTINPQRLVATLVANMVEAGGAMLRDEVVHLEPVGAERVDVATRTTRIAAAEVVVAAGAWSLRLLDRFGVNVPLESERGYHVMLQSPSVMPQRPVMIGDAKFFATPMEHGLRLAGTVEFAGLDARPDWRRSDVLLERAKQAFPGLAARGSTVWMGMRPSLPDSLPVIDRIRSAPRVLVAFGHGHLGMSGGPGTSRLVADLVAGRAPGIDPRPYRADRFSRRRDDASTAALPVATERVGR